MNPLTETLRDTNRRLARADSELAKKALYESPHRNPLVKRLQRMGIPINPLSPPLDYKSLSKRLDYSGELDAWMMRASSCVCISGPAMKWAAMKCKVERGSFVCSTMCLELGDITIKEIQPQFERNSDLEQDSQALAASRCPKFVLHLRQTRNLSSSSGSEPHSLLVGCNNREEFNKWKDCLEAAELAQLQFAKDLKSLITLVSLEGIRNESSGFPTYMRIKDDMQTLDWDMFHGIGLAPCSKA